MSVALEISLDDCPASPDALEKSQSVTLIDDYYSYHLRVCTLSRTDDPGDIVPNNGSTWETLRQTINKATLIADLKVMNVQERLGQDIKDIIA
ncbi:MAG: hypothetical protein MUF22_04965 [Chitinispirillaceae bacterium]|jgi:hypothetical protein|nr:hypothetical protein [Chitinispirillaceae bacterium]